MPLKARIIIIAILGALLLIVLIVSLLRSKEPASTDTPPLSTPTPAVALPTSVRVATPTAPPLMPTLPPVTLTGPAVPGALNPCYEVHYDRDEWGRHPALGATAQPTWTTLAELGSEGGITVDHHVALKDAHISGGCYWTQDLKNNFATDSDNLNPTTWSFNSSKGSRTPDRLTGIAKSIINTDAEKCAYATQHLLVKAKWGLAMTPSEEHTVLSWVGLCHPRPDLYDPTITPIPASTYPSCEAAQNAGVPRVRGSNGEGQGFPADLVPSARDGDKDGVVCER